MARKTVSRTLPSLPELFPEFHGFTASENRVERVTRLLQDGVRHVRQRHDTAFYSIREVARFLQVPTRTVYDAYSRLEAKGLLQRVRGSKTLVRSHQLQARHRVLGVVVVPVPLPAFVIGSLMRRFYLCLEEELRRRHFVLNFVFYTYAEEHRAELLDRVLLHEPDVVFWHAPPPAVRPVVETILDGGIPVVVVTEEVKGEFPRYQYRQDYTPALTEAFLQWRQSGITRFVIPCESISYQQNRFDLEMVTSVLSAMRLDHEVCTLSAADIPRWLRHVARQPRQGIILTPHGWYESLCNQYPGPMAALFSNCRVLLVHGPLYHPAFQNRAIFADVIDFNPARLASRIGRDLSNPAFWRRRDCSATFRMRHIPEVNLGSVSREI